MDQIQGEERVLSALACHESNRVDTLVGRRGPSTGIQSPQHHNNGKNKEKSGVCLCNSESLLSPWARCEAGFYREEGIGRRFVIEKLFVLKSHYVRGLKNENDTNSLCYLNVHVTSVFREGLFP